MLTVFIMLLIGHALADYPLQGDFLSKAKNHKAPIPGIPPGWALFWHSMIHAGLVMLITGNILFFWLELISHAAIDHAKCAGRIDFQTDQILHIAMKAFYVLIMFWLALLAQFA